MYGDSEVVRARVRDLREQAEELHALADRLVAQMECIAWPGRAGDSMRERVLQRAVELREVAGLHHDAAQALGRHLVEVDRLKDEIAAAERRAEGEAEFPPPGHLDWLSRTGEAR